ncbi:hypothetical protein Ancab_000900 [Ancistrocladus abbreviatus]
MDFNSRSINGISSNYFPPPTNAAYSAEQALRAGFPSTEFRGMELQRNEHHDVREAVHRELEKERIRAEIIAEEIARRRILEEEVRRELILERELALRKAEGFPQYGSSTMRVDSRAPLRTNFESRVMGEEVSFPSYREVGFPAFETLPFQRHPLAADGGSNVRLHEVKPLSSESGEVKLINLAKPNISLNCKAATPLPTSAVELPSIGLENKAKEVWSCALCQVSATNERGLNEHLQGRKHKAKEAELVAHRKGFGTGPLPKKTATGATSERGLNEHLQGRKHKAKEAELVAHRKGFGTGPLPKKTVTSAASERGLNEHLQGRKHKAKEAELVGHPLPKKTVTGATSERGLNEHLQGRKHKAKEAELVAHRKGLGTDPLPKKTVTGATSEQGLNEHLQGRKHKAKEAGLVAHRTGFGTGPLPKKTVTSASKPIKVLSVANASNLKQESSESKYFDASKLKRCIDSEKLDEKTNATPSTKTANAIPFNRNGEVSQFQKTPGSLYPKSKLKFWCSMCQVGATSTKMMNAHERGKKHLAKLLGQLNERIQAACNVAGEKEVEFEDENVDVAAEEEEDGVEEEMAAGSNSGFDSPSEY